MLSKGKINLILGLCLTSIVSVGFSSWVIGEEISGVDVNGNIEVDNVINNDCITLLSNSSSCFQFGEYGFTDENNYYVKNGYLEAVYLINVTKCRTLFEDLDSAYISLSLKYSPTFTIDENYGLFDSFEIGNNDEELVSTWNFDVMIKLNETNITLSPSEKKVKNKNEYNVQFEIGKYFNINEIQTETIQLSVQYCWELKDNISFFKNFVYPNIYDEITNKEKITFSLQATVTGE